MKDKYSAVWVSHSSMSDYLKCPRAYYLRNVYRDPKTNHKISLIAPALALGQAVHEVIESLSILPIEKRFEESLLAKFDRVWKKVSGQKGGFGEAVSVDGYQAGGIFGITSKKTLRKQEKLAQS
jgi:CRISPR/Cas system-associated exonuclease Cas4 (RecB family)